MNRDQLAARHATAIRHHWRTLVDSGGIASGPLLDELAAIAGEHAQDTGSTTPGPDAGVPGSAGGGNTSTPASPGGRNGSSRTSTTPRRTTARRTAR